MGGVQVDAGMRLSEGGDQPGEAATANLRGSADPQATSSGVDRMRGLRLGLGDRGNDASSSLTKHVAFLGQRELTGAAVHESHAQPPALTTDVPRASD